MSQINSKIKDNLQVVLLLPCFVGHPVLKFLEHSRCWEKCCTNLKEHVRTKRVINSYIKYAHPAYKGTIHLKKSI